MPESGIRKKSSSIFQTSLDLVCRAQIDFGFSFLPLAWSTFRDRSTFDLIDKFGIGNNTIHGLETLPSCGTTPRSSCQCQLMFANLLGFFFSFFFAVYTLGRIPLFNPIDCLRLVDVGSSSYSFLC